MFVFFFCIIEILYILLICMNIPNANYIILLYCTTSFSDIAPRRQALIFACLDRCSPSRHTAGSRNNVANMRVCFAGHMFSRTYYKQAAMHACCSLCQTIWTRGLPTRDSSSITGLVLDKSFP